MRTIDRILEISGLVLLVFSVGYILWHYGALPDRIAIHFNAQGEADGWDTKGSIYVLPFVFLFVIVLLGLLGRFLPPEHFNYPGRMDKEKREELYPLARTLLHGMQLSIGFISAYSAWSLVVFNMAENPTSTNKDLWVVLSAVFLPIIIYFIAYFQKR